MDKFKLKLKKLKDIRKEKKILKNFDLLVENYYLQLMPSVDGTD